MEKNFLLLTFVAVIATTSCSTVNSTVYTKGAVQSARSDKTPLSADHMKSSASPTVCIKPFIDLRTRPENISRLWMCAVPVLSTFSCWEKPNWLNWDTTYYAGYKPFSRDLTETVQSELRQVGCGAVICENETYEAPLVLEGTVDELTLTLRPHFFGTSCIIGEYLGLFGVPMGNWDVVQQISFKLVNRGSNKVIWQKTYNTKTDGPIAMYYGKNPLNHGYPYPELLEPVLNDVTANLKKYALETQSSFEHVATQSIVPEPVTEKPVVTTEKCEAMTTLAGQQSPMPATHSKIGVDTTTQLKKLKELKDAGLLTEQEYEAKRKALVGQL